MNKSKLLLTADKNNSAPFLEMTEDSTAQMLHLPLEHFRPYRDDRMTEELLKSEESFSFVIYGNLRNAKFFVEWAEHSNSLGKFKNSVHLVMDDPTMKFLENSSIPAIRPREHARPIDIMEFILRISRDGSTLYPCVKGRAEEMPGLLHELEMPVAEFPVCEESQLGKTELNELREQFKNEQPDIVLFHNRSSVTRTNAAFPDLDLSKTKIISGSAGVTKMLIDLGYEPEFEADGTWLSIAQVVNEL